MDGHSGVAPPGISKPGAYLFATDWLCLGEIAADLLGLVRRQDGLLVPRDEGIELIPSEHALARRLLPARTEALDAASVAMAVIRHADRHGARRPWLAGLLARKPTKLAAVALANKTARTAWALTTSGETYREPPVGQLAAA